MNFPQAVSRSTLAGCARQAQQAYEFIRKQVAAGRQAYIVVPQIDDNGLEESKSVRVEFDRLSKGALKGLRIAMLHGQMTTEEKQATMSAIPRRLTRCVDRNDGDRSRH